MATRLRLLLLLLFSLFLSHAPVAPGDPPEPLDLGLRERTGQRLVQIPVSVRTRRADAEDLLSRLTKQDFIVRLDGEEIPPARYTLDSRCPATAEAAPQADWTAAEPAPPVTPLAPGTKHYVFYIDHAHLRSSVGRDHAEGMINNMIPDLAADGGVMKIVQSYGRLWELTDWTSDAETLLAAVEQAFHPQRRSAARDTAPPETIGDLLEQNQVDAAIRLAKRQYLAKQRRFAGLFDPFTRLVGTLSALPMPKAVIYLADQAYPHEEQVVDAAVAAGVSIYAVKADGVPLAGPSGASMRDDPGLNVLMSLSSLSTRTGGAFGFGHFKPRAARIVLDRLEQDFRCLYIINIEADALDQDHVLSVRVRLREGLRKTLRIGTIHELIVLSTSARRQKAAADAHESPDSEDLLPATVAVIPISVSGGKVQAKIQVALDLNSAPTMEPARWDLGVLYEGGRYMLKRSSFRLQADSRNIFFLQDARFPLGDYYALAVGQEVEGDTLARGDTRGTFVGAGRRTLRVWNHVVAQQFQPGSFFDAEMQQGSYGWAAMPYGMLHPDLPLRFIGTICRGKKVKVPLEVRGYLHLPRQTLRFPAMDWPYDKRERCIVIQQKLPADYDLPWDWTPYEVTYQLEAEDGAGAVSDRADATYWVIGPSRVDQAQAPEPEDMQTPRR